MYKVIAYPSTGRPRVVYSGDLSDCRAYLARTLSRFPDLIYKIVNQATGYTAQP